MVVFHRSDCLHFRQPYYTLVACIGYCPERNLNELIVMVTVRLYSSMKASIEHQFVIISITHTKWWCISDSKKIVFWMSLQKVRNGCTIVQKIYKCSYLQ